MPPGAEVVFASGSVSGSVFTALSPGALVKENHFFVGK
jgi:hypothetical protein